MKYFNTDQYADFFIKLWEDYNDEEQSTDNDYEPDNNDDGFYDSYGY